MLDEDLLKNLPDTIWHYTTFKGLQGILKGTMRASCLRHLNDTNEFRQGSEVLIEELGRVILGTSDHPDQAGREQMFHRLTGFLLDYNGHDIYVACFSAKRDDLSQWRAYGSHSGPSFSIGFDPKILAAVAEPLLFELVKVEYDRAAQATETRELVRRRLAEEEEEESARSGPKLSPDQFTNRYGPRIVGDFILEAPRYKHPTFGDEEEWRLVRREPLLSRKPVLPLHFRESGSLVVPYLEFGLHVLPNREEATVSGVMTESPITEILIGPSPHPEELNLAVRRMADSFFLAANVENSEIPFRNW